ncbi:PfkB family carbohydrate kinase [Chryseobacterium sp.]|uniref:PfkB family carbohydrate kinase n=1 Tax=Chryseobacterium sp. TaxID=1871047 RepID=UPI00388DF8E6
MKFSSEQPKIVVVGSCTLDLVMHTDKIPCEHESVIANSSESFFGGKGANQAVGVARLDAHVYFIGCVGEDPLGQQIMRNLVDENVNVGFVRETSKDSTGTAYVTSCKENAAIVMIPAANNHISIKDIESAEKPILSSQMLLLQLEIPMQVIEYAAKKAKSHGKIVGLYASPGKKISEELISLVDFIIVKSNDLAQVFGEEQKEVVLRKYINKVFIRDETNSTLYFDGIEVKYFRNNNESKSYKMGMGDAFTSGFAVAMCHKNRIEDCVKFGNEVSAKTLYEKGPQAGLPHISDFK